MKGKIVLALALGLLVMRIQPVCAANYDQDFAKRIQKNDIKGVERLLEKRFMRMNLDVCMRTLFQTWEGGNSLFDDEDGGNTCTFAELLRHYNVDFNNSMGNYYYFYNSSNKPQLSSYISETYWPLEYAVRHMNILIVEYLLDHGAGINQRYSNGRTALMYAARDGKIDIVRLLIEKDADVNLKDVNGKTALAFAVEKNQEIVVDYLISRGANDPVVKKKAVSDPAVKKTAVNDPAVKKTEVNDPVVKKAEDKEPVTKDQKEPAVNPQNIALKLSVTPSTDIMGNASVKPEAVIESARNRNPALSDNDIAIINEYFSEAEAEKVNVDIAIAQMLYATSFFTNQMIMIDHNYAGFTDTPGWKGSFDTRKDGVKAHIQHLKGYASAARPYPLVDPRYDVLVDKGFNGNVKTFDQLYDHWSEYPDYGKNINDILNNLYQSSGVWQRGSL